MSHHIDHITSHHIDHITCLIILITYLIILITPHMLQHTDQLDSMIKTQMVTMQQRLVCVQRLHKIINLIFSAMSAMISFDHGYV